MISMCLTEGILTMVTSVSNATNAQNSSFTPAKQIGAMDKVTQEQLYAPGIYAMKQYIAEEEKPYKEKHGFLRFLGKIVLTVAVISGGAVAARKFIPKLKKENFDISKGLDEKAKFGDKAKFYLAKFADWIEGGFKGIFSKTKNEGGDNAPPKEPPATPDKPADSGK